MQIKIIVKLINKLELPISYHHILQSILYTPLRVNLKFNNLHDEGLKTGKREYKLFTFGPIKGHYIIKNKTIIFDEVIQFEVRSCYEEVITCIAEDIEANGIRFGDSTYRDIIVERRDFHIVSDDIIIQMVSPVTVHKTETNSNFTRYFNPNEYEFFQYVENNFIRKYRAYFGRESSKEVSFSKICVSENDKYITRYKNIIIEGYFGTYRLKGDVDALDFLYQVGLGAKNSQGFGMFEIV